MDRSDGNESANFSYLLRYNYTNGTIEFVTHGVSGTYSKVLIQNPYLERWYHVAVTRTGNSGIGIFTTYVDGRALSPFNDPANLGNTTGSGLAIGGVSGNARQFYGDIIEVAIYNTGSFQLGDIQNLRFADARSLFQNNLKGYYKLGYSTNTADYHNFATNAPTGTDPAVKVGSGNIGFELTDQAGEQSAYDSRKNHGDDALTPLSGSFTWQQTALARPVPGIAFDLRFGYSSGTPTGPTPDGAFDPYDKHILGLGWRNTFDTRLFIESNAKELKLLSWDGSIETWSRTNTLFAPLSTRSKEYRGELVQLLSGDLEWTNAERLVYHFRDPTSGDSMAGRLLQIRDFNNNSVQLKWDEGAGLLTNVLDTAGGSYQFNYDSARNLVTNITFGSWQVNFGYDTTNHLTSKSLANTSGLYASVNRTWQFRYNTNGLLAQIIDPRGNTNVFVQYDQYGRQMNQVDALNRATATRYGVLGNRQITRIDSETNQWIETYDRKGHLLAQQDPSPKPPATPTTPTATALPSLSLWAGPLTLATTTAPTSSPRPTL